MFYMRLSPVRLKIQFNFRIIILGNLGEMKKNKNEPMKKIGNSKKKGNGHVIGNPPKPKNRKQGTHQKIGNLPKKQEKGGHRKSLKTNELKTEKRLAPPKIA